jgi:hypothetical protein
VFEAFECKIHGIKAKIVKTAFILKYSWLGQSLFYMEGKWGYFKLTVGSKTLQKENCAV